MLADLTISLLAGIAIFPAVFAFGFNADAGPSLLFITIPAVFASMPLGEIFIVLFFVLTAIAATGAMLSLLEVPIAVLDELTGLSRTSATVITIVLLALVGAPAALSSSTLADFTIADKTMFDLYDYATSNVLLPVGGFFLSVFVGWVWGFDQVKRALSNSGALRNERIIQAFFGTVKFVTPVLVLLVLLDGLNVI